VIGTRERKRRTLASPRVHTDGRDTVPVSLGIQKYGILGVAHEYVHIYDHCMGDVHTYDPATADEYTNIYDPRYYAYIHTVPVFHVHIYDSYCRAERERDFVSCLNPPYLPTPISFPVSSPHSCPPPPPPPPPSPLQD